MPTKPNFPPAHQFDMFHEISEKWRLGRSTWGLPVPSTYAIVKRQRPGTDRATSCMPSLLLVTAAFAPSQWIGARRPERMALHLPRLGWQVTVLTLHPAYVPPLDSNLRYVGDAELVHTHAAMPRLAARKLRDLSHRWLPKRAQSTVVTQGLGAGDRPPPQPTLARWGGHLDHVVRQVEFPDEHIGWAPFAYAAVRGRRFDVVLATIPPFSAAVVAQRLAHHCQAKSVIDYRDSWTEVVALAGDDAATHRHRQAEDKLLGQADLVVGVTPTLVDRLQPRTHAPVAFIPNAIDDPLPAAPLPDHPRIAYVGSLAYGRDLQPIFRAMASLRQDHGTTVRCSYAGPHAALAMAQATEASVADLLDVQGQITLQAALQLVDGANAGVVISSPGYEYAWPGKIFEILGRGRPLLAMGPADSEVVRMPRQFGLGWGHTPTDHQGLLATLRAIAAGQSPDLAAIAQFSAAATMRDLAAALQQVLAAPPRHLHS